jgi:uncharacterized protein
MLMVRDNPTTSRYEMACADAVAFIDYRRAGSRIILIHTEVPEALSGQGVGTKFVAGVLESIRSEGATVVAQCTFVARFIEHHPGYQSLVAAE